MESVLVLVRSDSAAVLRDIERVREKGLKRCKVNIITSRIKVISVKKRTRKATGRSRKCTKVTNMEDKHSQNNHGADF